MRRKRKYINIFSNEDIVKEVMGSKDSKEAKKKIKLFFHDIDVSTGSEEEEYIQDFVAITQVFTHIINILLCIWSPFHWIIYGYAGYEFLDDAQNPITRFMNRMSGVGSDIEYGKYLELENKIVRIFDNREGKSWNMVADEVRAAVSQYDIDGKYVEVSNTFLDRLLIFVILPIYLAALLTSPIKYIITGRFGYHLKEDHWMVRLTDRVLK